MPRSYTRRKPSAEMLSTLEANVNTARENLKSAEEILELEPIPGWVRIQGMVESRIKGLDHALQDFEKMSGEERAIVLKERKDMRFFAGIVSDFKASLPAMNTALFQATQARDEYKKRMNNAG